MKGDNLELIIDSFGLDPGAYIPRAFGSGLIHKTYVLHHAGIPEYILQQVNHHVFKNPEDISHNLRIIGNFLKVHHPDYPFTSTIPSKDENDYVMQEGNYYRLFRFVKGTHTIDACTKPEQAYEAALQFGGFTATLNDFRTDMLRYTIPGFHDLRNRYREFLLAMENGNPQRINETRETAQWLQLQNDIVERYKMICTDPLFRQRVIHHDTKISNVLLNNAGKGVCVIDLDTVMPGYFISDAGDMIRTYVSPSGEEETDLDKIYIRKEFFEAILHGYMEKMGEWLSEYEKSCFVYAGKFMIYMQALRFFTDHLNNDRYYGAKYEGHNLNRANSQIRLLSELMQMEKELRRIS
jgi:aminoglycoside phosphotransferase (APT) family kinase protein